MIRLTRRYRFSASHRLHNPALPEDVNRELYGKCNNPYGHGHNYGLEVAVEGRLDGSGRVVDPRALDELVSREILKEFDHKNLNEDVPEFANDGCVPTSECLLQVIESRLRTAWSAAFPNGHPVLASAHLEETKNNKFDLELL